MSVGSTFRRRLTWTMSALAVGILALASAAIYFGVRTALQWNLDSALLSIARTEIASSVDAPGGKLHMHEEVAVNARDSGSGYAKFAQIKDADHRVRVQTANLGIGPGLETDRETEARALRGEIVLADLLRGGELYRAVYHPLQDAFGEPLVAVVATPIAPLRRSLHLLLIALTIALITGGLAAALGARRMAARLTLPLETIASAARAITATNLQGRIPSVSADVELRDMEQVLNAMLARLEEAFVAQSRFIADASHELRSPLSNLRGTVEVALRQSRSTEEYREALTIALSEAERMSRLVQELLMLSRVDAKQFSMDVAPCELSDIARGAVAAYAARAREKAIDLHLDAQPVTVLGDAHRLREVVDNLLDNGLRHAPSGSRVGVRIGRTEDHALLAVEDAGPGLSPDQQAHVFDRFYRVDDARARDSGGVGLGLPIAKAIVEAHSGRIDVSSEPGKGCRFCVRLPLVQESYLRVASS